MKSYYVQANESDIQAISCPIICHTTDWPVIMEQNPSFPGIYMKHYTEYHFTTLSDTQPWKDIGKTVKYHHKAVQFITILHT